MRHLMFCAVLVVAACGSKSKTDSTTPPGGGEDAEVETEDRRGDDMVDPEIYEDVTNAFRRKGAAVSRCWSDAVAAGKISKKQGGRVMLSLTILPDGKTKDVKIAESTLKSEPVEACVVGLVSGWEVPAPGSTMQFSFSYQFREE
jgi:TonB family protein